MHPIYHQIDGILHIFSDLHFVYKCRRFLSNIAMLIILYYYKFKVDSKGLETLAMCTMQAIILMNESDIH